MTGTLATILRPLAKIAEDFGINGDMDHQPCAGFVDECR
jgi:hypothetical protein